MFPFAALMPDGIPVNIYVISYLLRSIYNTPGEEELSQLHSLQHSNQG